MDGGGEDTAYPARSLRMDVEAAGETDAQRLESSSRVDTIIDDIVNVRRDPPERPPVVRALPPAPADFLAAIDGWIDVIYEPTDIIMRRSLEPPASRPVPVRYQQDAPEDPWIPSPPRSPPQAGTREDPLRKALLIMSRLLR